MTWSDIVSRYGGDARGFMQHFNDQLAKLAQRNNLTAHEALTMVVRGEFSKSALGGLGALGVLYGSMSMEGGNPNLPDPTEVY